MELKLLRNQFVMMCGGVFLVLGVSVYLISGCAAPPAPTPTPTPTPTPVLQLPIANAGTDQSAKGGATVILDGSASSSLTGSTLTFAWTQTGGTAVTPTSVNTAKPTFTAPNVNDVLTFQLIVSDLNGPSSPAAVKVTITAIKLPVANAGFDQSVNGGALVALNGSASSDPNGEVLIFAWTQTAGIPVALSGANTPTPNFTAPNVTGVLTFQLTVTDTTGVSSSASINVVVTGTTENKPPAANAGAAQTVNGGDTVMLNGTGSSDPNGDPLTFSWMQTAGTLVVLGGAATATPAFIAPNVNNVLTFMLTVSDGKGGVSSASVNITIKSTGTILPPVANPGTDQFINAGTTVTLDGANSVDPGGGTLTCAWTQTTGATVTLTGADTAKPTFVAPDVNEVLTFQLTVKNPKNLTNSASVNVTVKKNPPILFITNLTHKVLSYLKPVTVNGNIRPTTNLSGTQTMLSGPYDVKVAGLGGPLLVPEELTNAVTAYNDAVTATGNQAPNGNVQGAATGLDMPVSIALNNARDLAFIANFNANTITVYAGASTAGFNGNLAPIRTFTTPAGVLINPIAINFGADDDLYVVSRKNKQIQVFANAGTLNGTVNPTRIITSPAFNDPYDVFIDARDNMFVVDTFNQEVYMFKNAKTLNGSRMPDITLKVQEAATLTGIAMDANDTGFIVDFAKNAIYQFDKVSTRNGTQPPDRTIQGANTQLGAPLRVFLLE